jgi:hypothetical protein
MIYLQVADELTDPQRPVPFREFYMLTALARIAITEIPSRSDIRPPFVWTMAANEGSRIVMGSKKIILLCWISCCFQST